MLITHAIQDSSINMKCYVLAGLAHLVLLCAIYKIMCLTMPFMPLKEKANYLPKRMAFAWLCVSFSSLSVLQNIAFLT